MDRVHPQAAGQTGAVVTAAAAAAALLARRRAARGAAPPAAAAAWRRDSSAAAAARRGSPPRRCRAAAPRAPPSGCGPTASHPRHPPPRPAQPRQPSQTARSRRAPCAAAWRWRPPGASTLWPSPPPPPWLLPACAAALQGEAAPRSPWPPVARGAYQAHRLLSAGGGGVSPMAHGMQRQPWLRQTSCSSRRNRPAAAPSDSSRVATHPPRAAAEEAPRPAVRSPAPPRVGACPP